MEDSAKIQAVTNSAKVYAYRYNYTAETQRSFAEFFSKAPKQGVCHGDDMMMIYSNRNKPLFELSENDEKMMNIILDFWMSFSKTGYIFVFF